MPFLYKKLIYILKTSFPNGVITLTDLTGCSVQYDLHIISSLFNNLNALEQHRLVYKVLDTFIKNHIHALSLTTTQNL